MEHIPDESNKHGYKPIVCKKRIIIVKPVMIKAQFINAAVEKNIKSLFLFKQGIAKASIQFEKDAYYPAEVARVKLFVDNKECEKDIERVKIKLVRLVTALSSNKHSFKQTNILKHITYPG